MSDIRLKKITVEPSSGSLIIQRGDVNITSTTISTNMLNGALVIDGGMSISSTSDSISSTSGGSITIGGGVAIAKQTRLGDNLIIENNSATVSVAGISTNRLFLDNVTNKQFYISVDGLNKQIIVSGGNVSIPVTNNSTNSSSGALVIQGGISINNTTGSTDVSNGGALTVAGGASIAGNVNFGDIVNFNNTLITEYQGTNGSQIVLNNTSGNHSTINIIDDTLNVNSEGDITFYSSTGNFYFFNNTSTPFQINGDTTTFNKTVNIVDTMASVNSTTASFILQGGLSIANTSDVLSSTSGGAITIAGGLAVAKKILTQDSIGIQNDTLTKNNKLVLSGPVNTDTNFSGLGSTDGSLRFQVGSISKDFVFYSGNTNGNTSNETFKIMGDNTVQFIGNMQRYNIIGGGDTPAALSLQGQGTGDSMSFNMYSADGDTNDNVDLKIVGKGSPNSMLDSEYLKIGWKALASNYIIESVRTGTGMERDLVLQTNQQTNQMKLHTDGTLSISSTLESQNSTSGAFKMNGGLSINATQPAQSHTQGGALTVSGGMSVNSNVYIKDMINLGNDSILQNTDGNLHIRDTNSVLRLLPNQTSSNVATEFSMYSLNNNSIDDYQVFQIIQSTGNYNVVSQAGGAAPQLPINFNSQMFLATNGNIGINTSNPNYKLDVNGTANINGFTNIFNVLINSTEEAFNINSSGSLSVAGGASIVKNLFVGGTVNFLDTTNANGSSGSVNMSGGLSIQSGQASTYGSGALTVVGGGSFSGDVFIGNDIYIAGNIDVNDIFISNLNVYSTTNAINLTTGSAIISGGLTIQSSTNSVNITNGGSLLTPGGASIGRDLYIGGEVFNYNSISMFGNTNNLLKLYDTGNIIRFSIDRDVSSKNLSISRYNSSGLFIEKSLDISNSTGIIYLANSTPSSNAATGSIITPGGITINTSQNSAGIGNGGALTIAGGAAVARDLYIGGDTVIFSTTESNDSSTGSLIVHGGVGISGNLNILGNTIVNGNLTIMGTTTSVQTTNTLVDDNIIVLNSGPAGSKDSGFIIQRFQTANDTGTDDVVNDIPYLLDTLPSQSGMSSVQIKLSVATSAVNDYYNGWWIKITSGFNTNQVRKITGYIGSTHIATIDTPFTTQNPSINDTVSLYNKPFIGLVFNETNNRFELGSTAQDPGQTSIVLTDYLPFYAGYIHSTNTDASFASTSGSMVSVGGIGIMSTENALSSTSGGALTVGGGASITKDLYVGNSLFIGGVNITPSPNDISISSFTGANNVVTPSDITGLVFNGSVWGADIFLSAQLTATSNLYANYTIKVVNQNGTWDIATTYVGSNILTFTITNSGQIQYTCGNYPGFVSLIMKFRAITN